MDPPSMPPPETPRAEPPPIEMIEETVLVVEEPVVDDDEAPAGATTSYAPIVAAEFVGTAVLVLGGVGAAVLAPEIGLLGIAIAFGFALVIVSYVLGPISGCHVNPAVTLGMLLSKKIDLRHAAYAWGAQVLGAVFGAIVVYGIAAGRDGWERDGFWANGWDRDGLSGMGSMIVAEIVFTALWVFVALMATGRRIAPGAGALVTGLTLVVINLATIPVDNTGVNPARSIATAIFADTDPNALGQLWAFIVFPLIGAVVGVFVWLLVDEATLESTMFDTEVLRDTRDALDDVID